VRGACIDIGSNTTRLLVADCDRDGLRELHQERAFTRISRGLRDGDAIPAEKIAEVAGVVALHRLRAKQLGATEIHVVATAAIRRAGNRDELAHAIRNACGLEVKTLTGDEEARLAFVGAVGTLASAPDGPLGVVDVGGGSSEFVVGHAPDLVNWCASFALGSGDLADTFLGSDPPTAAQLEDARNHVQRKLAGLAAPRPILALAVGGSATSMRAVAGDVLDDGAFDRALAVLMSAGSVELAGRLGLDAGRVRLLPAGLVILRAAAELLRTPLTIGRGGMREGVLLEASA
jgi:exopolyphosphatase / guanosine-5'-triphosphate,3'-diphosphate pyrophosphatase